MAKRDYYEVLGVSRTASGNEIKRAFRKMAQQFHPDRNKEADAESRFKEVAEAYQILGDDQKRQMYDRYGHDAERMSSSPFVDMGDVGSLFEQFFGMGMGGSGGRTRRARAGNDLKATVSLSFGEAAFGATKDLDIDIMDLCDRCGGTGAEPGHPPEPCSHCHGHGSVRTRQEVPLFGSVVSEQTCPVCGGSGQQITHRCRQCYGDKRIPVSRTVNFSVPAGVSDGQRLRLSGRGEPGFNGGPPGDLYVEFDIRPHPTFTREGTDLLLDVPVTVPQATLGTVISIPMLEGDEEPLEIPPGTQPGTVFRKRAKGIPRLQSHGRGDMLITVQVVIPTRLDERQKELFRELADAIGEEAHGEKRGFFSRIQELLS